MMGVGRWGEMCRGEGKCGQMDTWGKRGREGRCCVGSGGDVWDGLGEVRRSVGEDVSICEERCGSVEKCCVWESVGRPKKVFTVAGVHFSAQNQGKIKKWSYMFHELSPPFAPISLFAPKEAISLTLRTAALQYRYSYTYGCCTEI